MNVELDNVPEEAWFCSPNSKFSFYSSGALSNQETIYSLLKVATRKLIDKSSRHSRIKKYAKQRGI